VPELESNLYHTKFIVAGQLAPFTGKLAITDNTVLYFGSHNFSAGAWGNQELKNLVQLHMSNTELGILFPAQAESRTFKRLIFETLPLKLPPQPYGKYDRPFILQK